MTRPTDELTRLLTRAADDIVDGERSNGPDAAQLWRKGRRVTWASRAAAAGIALAVMLLLVTGGLLVSGLPATAPATGEPFTYPQVVSDLYPGFRQTGDEPLFGLVATALTESESPDSLVIERHGFLTNLGTGPARGDRLVLSNDGTAPPLAPDGKQVLTDLGNTDPADGSALGIVDVTNGVATRPIRTDPVIESLTSSRGVWGPDSVHVLMATVDGPAVLDAQAVVVLSPAPGDQEVRAAGWRDDTTILGVRPTDDGGLAIVTRGLADPRWSTVDNVAADAVQGSASPSRVFAAPDGSRLLLLWPAGSGPARSVLVDARTGTRVPFAGETATSTISWDNCDPVWRAGQPLTAQGGLRRPATGEGIMTFSGHREHGCVSLAGNELTGAPAPGAAGAWQERTWRAWTAALPLGGVLALVGAVWMVLALRRSRRHGEHFLPMILRLPF